MDARTCRVCGIAEVHREKHNIIAKVSATDLHFGGYVRSLTAKNGAPGRIFRYRGFARLIQQHEPLHERKTGGRRHAGKRFSVASREKTNKLNLLLGTSRGKHAF